MVWLPRTMPVITVESTITAPAMSESIRHLVIFVPATGCRSTHNRTVVAMTVGHDGSVRGAGACGERA